MQTQISLNEMNCQLKLYITRIVKQKKCELAYIIVVKCHYELEHMYFSQQNNVK